MHANRKEIEAAYHDLGCQREETVMRVCVGTCCGDINLLKQSRCGGSPFLCLSFPQRDQFLNYMGNRSHKPTTLKQLMFSHNWKKKKNVFSTVIQASPEIPEEAQLNHGLVAALTSQIRRPVWLKRWHFTEPDLVSGLTSC